jgi:hypothetical protein
MQPIEKNERTRLVDQAAKAFPGQPRAGLEQEFDEMEALSAERFTREDGNLPQKKQSRLMKLSAKFHPK